MFTIKINNEYLPENVQIEHRSINLNQNQSGQRTVLNFTIIDQTGSGFIWQLLIGKKIELYEDNVLKFGGQIDENATRKINNKPILKQQIICIDWHFLADKMPVNQSYARQLISDTFKDIVDEFLSDDGIWYDSNSIQETVGQYISINCPYVYASDCFTELTSLINWQWRIGADKKIYLNEINYDFNQTLIENESDYLPNSLFISKNRDSLVNKQILKDVNALTGLLTEKATPTPDQDKTFSVRFDINQTPELYISTNTSNPPRTDMVDPREVGIGGLVTGLSWYWNKGKNIIQQDLEADAIPAGKYLIVKYVGQYKIDIIETNEDSINERKSIEGGSGVYASIDSATNIESIEVAETKAQSIINKYKNINIIISFSSYTIDLDVGQIIDINIPSFSVNTILDSEKYFLVYEKRTKDIGKLLLKEYSVCDGEPVGGWVEFFKTMLTTKDWIIREDAQVNISIDSEESSDWSGEITVSRYTPLYPEDDPGGLYPGNLLYPGTFIDSNTYND